jgi:hypothetical protein
MGEAKQRRDALAVGQPLSRDLNRCPDCGSRNTVVRPSGPIALSHTPTLMAGCLDCETVWEAFPPDWRHDAVGAPPCDNCAFAAGSPESSDREAWRSLLAKLRLGQEFKCHKGAPLVVDRETSTVEFDADWIREHGRTCAGFLRVMQQWPDWLDNRFSVSHVLTTYDQDQLLGETAESEAACG